MMPVLVMRALPGALDARPVTGHSPGWKGGWQHKLKKKKKANKLSKYIETNKTSLELQLFGGRALRSAHPTFQLPTRTFSMGQEL